MPCSASARPVLPSSRARARSVLPSSLPSSRKAGVIIALKGNQGALHDDVRRLFSDRDHRPEAGAQASDADHGRIETRSCGHQPDRLAHPDPCPARAQGHWRDHQAAKGCAENNRRNSPLADQRADGRRPSQRKCSGTLVQPERPAPGARRHDARRCQPQPQRPWAAKPRPAPKHGPELRTTRGIKRIHRGKTRTRRMGRCLPHNHPQSRPCSYAIALGHVLHQHLHGAWHANHRRNQMKPWGQGGCLGEQVLCNKAASCREPNVVALYLSHGKASKRNYYGWLDGG